MLNPVLWIAALVIFAATFLFCFIHRPKGLVLTAVSMVLTGFFVAITWYIESMIESTSIAESGFLNFIVLADNFSYIQLSNAFSACRIIDIALFIITIVSLILEMHNIFKSSAESKR